MKVKANKTPFFSEFSLALSQMFKDAPLGLATFDLKPRYVHVNERMASFNGKTIEEHPGKGIKAVNPDVASVLEPIVLHAMESGTSLVDLETEVPVAPGGRGGEPAYWRIGCFPLKGQDGTLHGTGVIVRDITEEKLKAAAQEELLKFESLLADLSAAFINVPVIDVDGKVEKGLQKIVDFLEFDRCSIWQFHADDGRLHLLHSYSLSGIKQPPPIVDEQVPIWTDMWRRGEMFKISDVDELPDEFWREKQYCRDMGGIKSFLFIPLCVGGGVVGLVSFAAYRVKMTWSEGLVQRLRLLGDVFGNALERKRADQEMQKALAEIGQLKDRLEAENLYLRDQIKIERMHEEIIGQSVAIRKVLLQVEQVAATDSTVLVLGETGTGKELVARAIHSLSGRKDHAMIKLNCAALPPTLIEAELFGREKGAYTGALTTQIGRFEAANGSTIFLDEIGELPLELQTKLLRVLQEGQFERLGSSTPISVNVRVIAATNRDLSRAVAEGRFREDLYYRLNVFPISVPPLRERVEDIPLLVWAMVREFGKIFGKSIERIPKKNMDALMSYRWPGNIRELRNVVERAMILCCDTSLVVELPERSATTVSRITTLEETERVHILAALERTGWRVRGRNGAAELLGLKPTTLESKMKKLEVKRKTIYTKYSATSEI